MNKTLRDCVIHASGMYLTSYLPDNYDEMPLNQLDEWVASHACEAYEYWGGERLLAEIEECADHWYQLINEQAA